MFFLIETQNLGPGYNQELIHESKVDGIRPWKNDTTMITVGPRQIFVNATFSEVQVVIQQNTRPVCSLIQTNKTPICTLIFNENKDK